MDVPMNIFIEGQPDNRIYLTCKITNLKFLICSNGYSMIPYSAVPGLEKKSFRVMSKDGYADSMILTLDLGLTRIYRFQFHIADVLQPIIGADFLMHYKFGINIPQRTLLKRIPINHLPSTAESLDFRDTDVKYVRLSWLAPQTRATMEDQKPKFDPRLFLTDKATNIKFLVCGAVRSVIPRSVVSNLVPSNDNSIDTITLPLDFGLGRIYSWQFDVTNNSQPLIALDFQRHYKLTVDLYGRRIIDPEMIDTSQ